MLTGRHLLTVPTLAEKARSITSQTDEVCEQLAVLLGYRKETADQLGGIEYLMEDYLEKRGILRDDEPLTWTTRSRRYSTGSPANMPASMRSRMPTAQK